MPNDILKVSNTLNHIGASHGTRKATAAVIRIIPKIFDLGITDLLVCSL